MSFAAAPRSSRQTTEPRWRHELWCAKTSPRSPRITITDASPSFHVKKSPGFAMSAVVPAKSQSVRQMRSHSARKMPSSR